MCLSLSKVFFRFGKAWYNLSVGDAKHHVCVGSRDVVGSLIQVTCVLVSCGVGKMVDMSL